MMLLVKFNSDWADEFDVAGFTVMPEEDWKFIQEVLKFRFEVRPNDTVDWCFGTNEWFQWESYIEFKNCFSSEGINDYQAKVLGEFFYGYTNKYYTSFGGIPFDSYKEQVLELATIHGDGYVEVENNEFVWKDEKNEEDEKTA